MPGLRKLLLAVILVTNSVCVQADELQSCIYSTDSFGLEIPAIETEQPERHFGRARPFDIKHIKLEIAIDFDRESLAGSATTTLAAVGEARNEIVFDSIGLDISRVTDSREGELEFEVTGDKLNLFLDEPAKPDTEFSVTVEYRVERPVEGLYFRTERMGYEDDEVQVWTQGEPQGARFWFPCYDFPNERAATELVVTVPDEFTALSNGRLVETRPGDRRGTTVYHWRESVPHVTYLVSLIVGKYAVIHDSYGDLPVNYYVRREFRKDAHFSFSKTPDMIKFFEKFIGVPYPYEKYAQVAVVDFIAGGMENTSITTLTERTLHDESAHMTVRSDGLVAHELAHQWFGDLITCRDWSHLWLNEGFATYFAALYTEHDLGNDEFMNTMRHVMDRVIGTDKGDNRSPIVRSTYDSPRRLFDARSYQKGAAVLHMLRHKLGDDMFRKCIAEYCKSFSGKVVETTDLLRTIERVSGSGAEQFFDQWVYHGGYPELKVSYSWMNEDKTAKVVVKQTHKVDDITPLYRFDTELLFACSGGDHVETIEIEDTEHVFHIPLPTRPKYVRFDPDLNVLKVLKFKKPKPMLLDQIEKDTTAVGRILALEGLKTMKGDDIIETFAETLISDPFWGVREEAATMLGEMDNEKRVDALVRGLDQDDARVRVAVVKSLGKIDEDSSRAALVDVMNDEKSPYVVAAAVKALGKMKEKDARKIIVKTMSRESHNEVVRRAALEALVHMDDDKYLKIATDYCAPDHPRPVRQASISAVGKIGKWMENKSGPRKTLTGLLQDPISRMRFSAIDALGELGDPRAINNLERAAETARTDREKKRAEKAIDKINSQGGQMQEVARLREQIETMEKSFDELDGRMMEIESLIASKQDGKETDGMKKDDGSEK